MMANWYGLVGVFALAATGCAAPVFNHAPQMTYHVDTSFTAPERQCLEDATKQWRDQTSGLADIKLEYDYKPNVVVNVLEHEAFDKVVRWTSTTPYVVAYEAAMGTPEKPWILLGQTSHKITDSVRLPIVVSLVQDRLDASKDTFECKRVAMHEFGHGLGLPHMGRTTDIMFPSEHPLRSACLKNDDLVAFAAVNELPSELMKPCPNDSVLDASDAAEEEDPNASQAQ